MKARVWVFWALLLAMFGYEAYAILTPSVGDTISEVTWAVSEQAPIVTFAFGVLSGHFFWPRYVVRERRQVSEDDHSFRFEPEED